jgi:hypothetical protein
MWLYVSHANESIHKKVCILHLHCIDAGCPQYKIVSVITFSGSAFYKNVVLRVQLKSDIMGW